MGKKLKTIEREDGVADRLGAASVERALSIIAAFETGDFSLSLAELAARTGLYKSTIIRLCHSLEKYGMLTRLMDKSYKLGMSLVHYGDLAQASLNWSEIIRPSLIKMSSETLESASFFVRRGQKRLCLLRVNSPKTIRDHISEGDLLPLDRGAAGRIITQYDSPCLDGMAHIIVSIGERDPELAAVGCPVFTYSQNLAGVITISGPSIRFTDMAIKRIVAVLETHCRELTARLGGNSRAYSNNIAAI